ncbi:MAG: 16S rRNA (cytidine(1402)-2'-O)-methyltransferase [Clostridiaceae bacterium]|jgi:16S rRNA (cytidine1402-2'-O)-methyltransferase|nr:16S rRNA (cytidine(1402)-2'-O)-methyltransferase [Clostridiaceae bacterium]
MEDRKTGTLSLVATPIGNLEDISFRAIKTLEKSDFIAAEDTRHTLKLLNHYDIKKPLISYFEHNKKQRGEALIRLLQEGANIALVTDAGSPGISDPGEDIVKLAIQNNILVTMVPGPTASIMGLVLSGLSCDRFCFEGFLPHDRKARRKRLEMLETEERTIIFYLSPHRTLEVLGDVQDALGNRTCAICRELTKKHEEILRGTIEEMITELSERESIKGEMVLIVEGNLNAFKEDKDKWLSMSIEDHMKLYLESGLSTKEAMKRVALDRGTSKRDIYSQYCIRKE